MSEPLTPQPDPIDVAELRRRQHARARVMGWMLGGLAILFFAITIAKLGLAQ